MRDTVIPTTKSLAPMNQPDWDIALAAEMLNPKWMHVSRWKASAVHLLVSIGVAIATFVAMEMIWYTAPYFQALGGKALLTLLMGVDVVLGPLITLIIFNPKKKSLKLDLASVAIIQIAALAYGVSVIFHARPAYTVFAQDSFYVVPANEIDDEQLAKVVNPQFKTLPLMGPRFVAADEPTNDEEKELVTIANALGMGVQNLPQHYVPYADRASVVLAKAKNLSSLKSTNPEIAAYLQPYLDQYSIQTENVAILPVHAKNEQLTALIDNKTAGVVRVVPVSTGRIFQK